VADAGAHHATVEELQGHDQHVGHARPEGRVGAADDHDEDRGQADDGVQGEALDLGPGGQQLVGVQLEGVGQPVGAQVQQHEHDLDGDEARAVDRHQQRRLAGLDRLDGRVPEELVEQHREQELHRVDVETAR
jgi:hypothetical protein